MSLLHEIEEIEASKNAAEQTAKGSAAAIYKTLVWRHDTPHEGDVQKLHAAMSTLGITADELKADVADVERWKTAQAEIVPDAEIESLEKQADEAYSKGKAEIVENAAKWLAGFSLTNLKLILSHANQYAMASRWIGEYMDWNDVPDRIERAQNAPANARAWNRREEQTAQHIAHRNSRLFVDGQPPAKGE